MKKRKLLKRTHRKQLSVLKTGRRRDKLEVAHQWMRQYSERYRHV